MLYNSENISAQRNIFMTWRPFESSNAYFSKNFIYKKLKIRVDMETYINILEVNQCFVHMLHIKEKKFCLNVSWYQDFAWTNLNSLKESIYYGEYKWMNAAQLL